jgi:hypothetical protein
MPIRLIRPVISCFPDLESRNINTVVLIPGCLARVRASTARRPGLGLACGRPRGLPG